METNSQADTMVKTTQFPRHFLERIRESMNHTFSSFSDSGLKFLGFDYNQSPFNGIVGIISLVGDISCSIAIGLSRELGAAVAEKFIGFPVDYDSEDMADLIGELINIIGGDLGTQLANDGINVELSLPAATRGNPLQFIVPEKNLTVRLVFNCPNGEFWVDVALNQQAETMSHTKELIEHKEKKEEQETVDMIDATATDGIPFSPAEIDAMKQSVLKCFHSMTGENIEFIGFNDDNLPFNGIVGIVSMVGQNQTWSLMFGFSPEAAVRIGGKFAGFEIDYDSDDMGDVIGELANVVAGDAMTQLDALGIKVDLSIPTIARGRDMNMLLAKDIAKMHYNFRTSTDKFWMKLATERH